MLAVEEGVTPAAGPLAENLVFNPDKADSLDIMRRFFGPDDARHDACFSNAMES